MTAREYPTRPFVGIGIVVIKGDHVLLCQRGKPPNLGSWTLPGGAQDLGETCEEAARRELMEEVSIDVTREVAVAVLNDDSTEVGFVHLGVVHIVYVADEALANRRSGIVSPEFTPISEAVKNPDAYESWSRICLENLDALFSKAAAIAPDRVVA